MKNKKVLWIGGTIAVVILAAVILAVTLKNDAPAIAENPNTYSAASSLKMPERALPEADNALSVLAKIPAPEGAVILQVSCGNTSITGLPKGWQVIGAKIADTMVLGYPAEGEVCPKLSVPFVVDDTGGPILCSTGSQTKEYVEFFCTP